MAKIVGGFVMPHEPGIFYMPEDRWTDGQRRVMAAYGDIARRIGELGATAAIVVGADHYVLFGPGCLPSYLIGIGDVSGPYEKFAGIDQGPIPNHVPLAEHIAFHGRANGFDWAVAKVLRVDHSIGLPARVCALSNPSVRGVIPVYLASGVEPVISLSRAYELGGALRRAVEAWAGEERVVVIGSGGISHWVGMPQMGRVNEAFDRQVLECVVRGDAAPLLALRDADVLEQAGNGAFEIRNFLCMMGALPGRTGRLLCYEHGDEWVTGLGFAEVLEPA
ncbi:protocatechuate 3,4-dioxygenase [Pigmentiphaga sp. NML080357]|uniref:DODA-type extradiol aromatic ring-opening family dioxygenase n=1 Tax=Pigmentiphaga sp. NML080357 TaxID=2008675 RepID=UPI000B412783|nr:protocatechuate 3,4-dioxygenase [Pigmentiphaga sp. NML080357]OVZ56876.1 protocatechuate 3,4-dioxygenase [Pigmentiphaga sp. NML080357]